MRTLRRECQSARNLEAIDKVPLLERKREILAEQAKQRFGGKHKHESTKENLPELNEGQTRDAVAATSKAMSRPLWKIYHTGKTLVENLPQAFKETRDAS